MHAPGPGRSGWLAIRAGLAAALLLALVPAPALAADPLPAAAGDGSATLLVILLLGSLTAGLFFASPLRRRLVRASPTSTRAAATVGRGSRARRTAPPTVAATMAALGRLGDRAYRRLATMTERWPVLRTATPLPPMLGGDIFLDDEPAAEPAAPHRPPATPDDWPVPWSNAPLSAERYGPFR